MAATKVRSPEVDIELVHVVDGSNSRQHLDPGELKRMAETMKLDAIVAALRLK